jgi:hypothetical protein
MKRMAIVVLALALFGVLAVGQTSLTRSDYHVFWVNPQGTVLGGFTSAGNFATRGNVAVGNGLTVVGTTAFSGALAVTGNLTATGTLHGLYAANTRSGVSATVYTNFAMDATSGNLTISRSGGSTGNVAWTAAAFGFTGNTTITGTLAGTSTAAFTGAITSGNTSAGVGGLTINNGTTAVFTITGATGNLMADGATISLDGSTSVRGISAGFVSLESPANRLGVNATEYMQVATTATTGATAITHTGSGPAVTWTATSLAFTGNFSVDGTTVLLDGSTSVRGVSAGFVSLEGPSIRLGSDATYYLDVAVTTTTGAVAITHAGAATPDVTWTMGSLSLTGNFSSDGATVLLDGSTSVRNVSAGFVISEAPEVRFGLNATEYMQVAVTVTTGATAITHTGTTPTVAWTANSFGFTGDTTITGTLEVTGMLTASAGLTWSAPLVVGGSIYHTNATHSSAVMVSVGTLSHTNGNTAKEIFVLPANAIVVDVLVDVSAIFNSDGTDALAVGISGGTADLWVAALSLESTAVTRMGAAGTVPATGLGTVGAADVTVIARNTTVDLTNITTGAATVYVYWYLAP